LRCFSHLLAPADKPIAVNTRDRDAMGGYRSSSEQIGRVILIAVIKVSLVLLDFVSVRRKWVSS